MQRGNRLPPSSPPRRRGRQPPGPARRREPDAAGLARRSRSAFSPIRQAAPAPKPAVHGPSLKGPAIPAFHPGRSLTRCPCRRSGGQASPLAPTRSRKRTPTPRRGTGVPHNKMPQTLRFKPDCDILRRFRSPTQVGRKSRRIIETVDRGVHSKALQKDEVSQRNLQGWTICLNLEAPRPPAAPLSARPPRAISPRLVPAGGRLRSSHRR